MQALHAPPPSIRLSPAGAYQWRAILALIIISSDAGLSSSARDNARDLTTALLTGCEQEQPRDFLLGLIAAVDLSPALLEPLALKTAACPLDDLPRIGALLDELLADSLAAGANPFAIDRLATIVARSLSTQDDDPEQAP